MPKRDSRYTALFTHPGLKPFDHASRKEAISLARIGVRNIGGSARVVRNTAQGQEPIYECWRASTSGGVRGSYKVGIKAKKQPENCPDCHAPLRPEATKKKFHVAPRTPLGKPCRTCGQIGMSL